MDAHLDDHHPHQRDLGETTPFDLAVAIRRLNHVLTAILDFDLYEMGVSFAQLEVMIELERRPDLHAGELARTLGVTRQAVHHRLWQLGRGDLIDLLPRDHGVRAARLTHAGHRRLRHCRRAIGETMRALATIPPETRDAACVALLRCERALQPWHLRL